VGSVGGVSDHFWENRATATAPTTDELVSSALIRRRASKVFASNVFAPANETLSRGML